MVSLSYTKIGTLLRCPRSYELQYIDRVEVLSKPALFLGGSVHVALAEGYQRKLDGVVLETDAVAEIFSRAWEKQTSLEDLEGEINTEVDWRGEDKALLKDTGIALLKSYWDKVQPHIEPAEVELWLERDIAGVLLRGKLDLVLIDASWVDHKTTSRAYSEREVKRNLQTLIYSLLLGGATRGAFHLLVKTKIPYSMVMPFSVEQGEVDWIKRALLPKVVAQIRSGIFPPNPTNLFCDEQGCSVHAYCRKG